MLTILAEGRVVMQPHLVGLSAPAAVNRSSSIHLAPCWFQLDFFPAADLQERALKQQGKTFHKVVKQELTMIRSSLIKSSMHRNEGKTKRQSIFKADCTWFL